MNATQRASLTEQLAQFNAQLDLSQACSIPKAWFVESDFYEAERQTVFANSWLLACRADEVSQPGSYITTVMAGEPIIVVRGKDGQLRAFSNVCRHQAARVATCPSGTATHFRCHYHGWTYSLDGRLRGTPEFSEVCDFDKKCNSLPAWSVDTWGPYVFVQSPLATDKVTLAEFLKPLPERCQPLGLEKFKFVRRRDYHLNCNWKLFCDNYLDGGYHVNTIHPALAGAIDYKNYRTELAGNTAVQISPLKKSDDAEVASVRSGRDAYYWWALPNLMLNIYETTMDMNLVLPLGPDKCRVIFDFFFLDTEGEAAQERIEKSIAVAHQIQLEDMAVCEEVQTGLASAHFNTGRFSVKRESGRYEFHKLLARQLGKLIAPPARDRAPQPADAGILHNAVDSACCFPRMSLSRSSPRD